MDFLNSNFSLYKENILKWVFNLHKESEINKNKAIKELASFLVKNVYNKNILLTEMRDNMKLQTGIVYIDKRQFNNFLATNPDIDLYLTMYLFNKFNSFIINILKYDGAYKNIMTKLGYRCIKAKPKKVMGEIYYFIYNDEITKRVLMGVNLLEYNFPKELENKIVYNLEKDYSSIRASRKIEPKDVHLFVLEDFLKFYTNQNFKQIFNNMLMYFLMEDFLKYNDLLHKKNFPKIYMDYFLDFTTWISVLPDDLSNIFLFEKEDGRILPDKEFVTWYFARLLLDISKKSPYMGLGKMDL